MIGRDGTCHLLMVEVPAELYDHGGSLFDAGSSQPEVAGTTHFLTVTLPREHHCARSAHTPGGKVSEAVQQQVRQEVDSVIFAEKPYYDLSHENLDLAMAFLNNNNHYLDYATDGLISPHRARMTACMEKMKRNSSSNLIIRLT